ncbi:MAG TPA: 6-bladed beta-propeller [Gemmatimonadaceae bacterium]|nr:6-bladed beta-propeller [Gemmatimonadaceae bacterium]
MSGRLPFTSLATLLALVACAPADGERLGTWVAERDTIGDTIVVRTISGSIRDGTATLVEDLSIGVLEGAEELMLGQISSLAVDSAGGIYAFDGQVPALRYFDSTGAYVRTLGAKGAGPGEYEDASLGLAVRHHDGRVVMRDPRNGRMNVYNPDGSPSTQWTVTSGLFTNDATVLDTADHLYLRILLSRPERNKPWNIGLLHLDDSGRVVDSIAIPAMPGEPEGAGGAFLPAKIWAWSPLGYLVVGVNDTYRFEVRAPGAPVVRIERSVPVVEVLPEEHAELEARNDWYRKYQGQFMTAELPPVPHTKPPWRSFLIGQDGRIWVRRHTTAEHAEVEGEATPQRPAPPSWVEPAVYDVFEPDGRYLGEVRAPTGVNVSVVRGDQAWGLRQGDMGEQLIVRLHLVHADSAVQQPAP